MWAVVQAARSEIHFGYMEYAVQRMAQYYQWKDKLIARFSSTASHTRSNPPTARYTGRSRHRCG